MTAKEYLSQAGKLKIRIMTMREQLVFMKSATEYTSPQYGDTAANATPNIRKTEDYIIRCLDKEDQIKAVEKSLGDVIEIIDSFEDEIKHSILVKRYLCRKKWQDIAKELFISRTAVYNIHAEILEEIELLIKK
jgi:DNA-directed RNA polymerase specialized sigma subunit